jgi:crotonobetainyl-CoA:carnitine CoA-transferase CaiB-like acyl-CoA transferase
MSLPLDGLRVLDLSRILAGPSCTQTLGDLGADVIKVERPGKGDDVRGWGPPFLKDAAGEDTAESAYFISTNRNKRSLTVDIGSPEGREIVEGLVDRSDVLVENFKVGDLDRRGFGWEEVHARNPRLVYCSITGFGQSGPYAERPGYDFIIQGMGGLMSITGAADGPPTKVGVPISDIMAGMYATVAILAALQERERTGEGRRVDISLLDCQAAWLYNQAANHLVGGVAPHRLGNAHPNIVPYETFATADGHINIGVGNDAQFRRLCEILGRADLAADDRFATNTLRLQHRAALVAEIGAVLATRDSTHWLDACTRASLPAGPINTVPEVFEDAHIRARGLVRDVAHSAAPGEPAKVLRTPIRMEGVEFDVRRPPPTLGEHTEEVLGDLLGYSPAQVQAFRGKGVI